MIPLSEKLQSISVVMMAGGTIFFATVILLSVYRGDAKRFQIRRVRASHRRSA